MKKIRNKIVAILASVCCIAALVPAVPAMADGQKVVTLGADLSEDQQIMMLEYFGVYGEPVETLFINNTEEREHLSAYVPLEQIGTRTVSCAIVNPTTSGGIQVKTANLTWVTGYMIASTLSTSGVVNCEVIAAAPFPVSGTGALTGIMMAYETASGETLDEAKKDAATEELVATATIAGDIGEETAVQIVNETKVEVVQNNGASTEEIQGIIDDALQKAQVSLSDEDRDLLTNLLEKVSDIDYGEDEIDAMKDSVSTDTDTGDDESPDSGSSPEGEDGNSSSIFDDTDPDVLGDDVVQTDSSNPGADEDDTDEETQTATGSDEDDGGFEIFDEGTVTIEPEGTTEEPEGTTEEPEGTTEEPEGTTEEPEGTTEEPEGTTEEPTEGTVTEEGGFPVSDLVLIPNAANGEDELVAVPDEASEKAAPGTNCLIVQSEMTDLVAGSGEISVYDAEDDAEPFETVLMDDEHVVREDITDYETLQDLKWDAGVEFRIILDVPLDAGKSYYVVLSEDAFETEDGSKTLTESGVDDWTFETAEYGISVVETVEGIKSGETAKANLYMDPEADYAIIEYFTSDGTDNQDVGQFDVTGPIEITFDKAGTITVRASFYAGVVEEPEEPEVSEDAEDLSGFVDFEGAETFALEPISVAEYTVTVIQ